MRSTRDGSDDGEREYKATLAEALAWGRGFKEGAKACAAWTEAQEASALASETLSQNPPADEGPGAKRVGAGFTASALPSRKVMVAVQEE